MPHFSIPPSENTYTSSPPKQKKLKVKRTPNKLKHIPPSLFENGFDVRLNPSQHSEPYNTLSRYPALTPTVAEDRHARRPNSRARFTKTANATILNEIPSAEPFPSPSHPTMYTHTYVAVAAYRPQLVLPTGPYSSEPMANTLEFRSSLPSIQHDHISRSWSSSISSDYLANIRSSSSSSSSSSIPASVFEASPLAGVYGAPYPSYQECDVQELISQFNAAPGNSTPVWTYGHAVEGAAFEDFSGNSAAHFTQGGHPGMATESHDAGLYFHREVERDPRLLYQDEDSFPQVQEMNPSNPWSNFPLNTYQNQGGASGIDLSEYSFPGSGNYQLNSHFEDTVYGEGH